MQDKVILVTGGTTGIGRATAVAFGAKGSKVVITGRRAAEGKKTVELVRDSGGVALFIEGDVSRDADVQMMVDRSVGEFGRIDFAFNNAGVEGTFGPLETQTEQNFDYVMNVNVRGLWLSMKYEILAMLKTGGGSIVNNSSVAGLCGFANSSIYAASKHAVIGLTKAGAIENAERGIRINAICPGGVQTEMVDRLTGKEPKTEAAFRAAHPMNRLGTPEEVAQTVQWLCSEGAGFITGQAIGIDGGVNASFGGRVKFGD